MSTEISFAKLSIEARTEVIKEAMESTLWSLEKSEKEIEFLRARLQEQKEALGHGRWLPWIRETFGDNNATVQKIQRFLRAPESNKSLLIYLDDSTGEVPRSSRKPGRVKVVEPPADHIAEVNEKVDDGTDDDPTPDPPTIRKTAAGSRKVPESEKPPTRPVQAELLPDEPEDGAVILRESDTDGIQELYNRVIDPDTQIHNVCNRYSPVEIFDLMVSITTGENKKRIAKLMRKAADKLDPPDESPKPEKVPTIAQLIRAIPDEVNSLQSVIEKWARHKQSLQGKARVRSMESWQTMIEQMLKACDKYGVAEVSESIRASIANGYTGWDIQLKTSNGKGNNGHTESLNDRVAAKAARLKDIFG